MLLIVRKQKQGIPRPAFLETARSLEVVELTMHLAVRDVGQRLGRWAGRMKDAARNPLCGLLDISEFDRHRRHLHYGYWSVQNRRLGGPTSYPVSQWSAFRSLGFVFKKQFRPRAD